MKYSVTDLLADSLALTGSATLDGLTAQGNVGCDQLLCNDVNCTDVFTTGVDASGAVSAQRSRPQAPSPEPRCRPQGPCQVARLEHHGGGQRGPAKLSHRNHGQHVDHQQHGQRRELHHRLLGRSLSDEELAGASCNSAASDSGLELRLLGNQSARSSWSGTAGRTSASSS